MSKNIPLKVSGGKDSTATLLRAMEEFEKKDLIVIFSDTGWEHPYTYQYLDYLEKTFGIKINRLKTEDEIDLPNLIRRMKRFPHPTYRFCTETLKQLTFMSFLKRERLFECTNWLGIRKSESIARRKKYFEVQPDLEYPVRRFFGSYTFDLKYIRLRFPVINMSVQEVFAYIRSKGIDVNTLYKQGHSRVGCYPCLLSSKKDFFKLLNDDVGIERIDKLIQLETEIGDTYKGINLKQLKESV